MFFGKKKNLKQVIYKEEIYYVKKYDDDFGYSLTIYDSNKNRLTWESYWSSCEINNAIENAINKYKARKKEESRYFKDITEFDNSSVINLDKR